MISAKIRFDNEEKSKKSCDRKIIKKSQPELVIRRIENGKIGAKNLSSKNRSLTSVKKHNKKKKYKK